MRRRGVTREDGKYPCVPLLVEFLDFGFHFRHEGADRAFAGYKVEGRGIAVSKVQATRRGPKVAERCETESLPTFRKFTKLLLHVRHCIPLLLRRLLLLLLLRRIIAMDRCVSALRIRELAHLLLLLLLLLSQRDLVAGKLLLILEQQLARELLVQLSLFGL